MKILIFVDGSEDPFVMRTKDPSFHVFFCVQPSDGLQTIEKRYCSSGENLISILTVFRKRATFFMVESTHGSIWIDIKKVTSVCFEGDPK